MKAIIIDDSAEKIRIITETLLGNTKLKKEDITTAPDISIAKGKLKNEQFDLMVLDIQIPERFGETPNRDGGIELLRHIKNSRIYNVPSHIIAITAYDDISEEGNKTIQDDLIHFLKYSKVNLEWQHRLTALIKRIEGSRGTRRNVDYIIDVAIITALNEKELKLVKDIPFEWEKIEDNTDMTIYFEGHTINSNGRKINIIAATANRMGIASSTALAMKVIDKFRPRYLIMTGIAAGLDSSNQNIGDILVASKTWDYGSGKYEEVDGKIIFSIEPDVINTDIEIINKIREIPSSIFSSIKDSYPSPQKPNSTLMCHFGPVVSGSAVRADGDIIKVIKSQNRKSIGLEMETYGLYIAAEYAAKPAPKVISIKSISDFADSKKGDNFQHYSAYTSAQFGKYLIQNVLSFD